MKFINIIDECDIAKAASVALQNALLESHVMEKYFILRKIFYGVKLQLVNRFSSKNYWDEILVFPKKIKNLKSILNIGWRNQYACIKKLP